MSAIQRHLSQAERDRVDARGGRRTAQPRSDFVRFLNCTVCGDLCEVFEATLGARTREEHQFEDPETFRCSDCLVVKVVDDLSILEGADRG